MDTTNVQPGTLLCDDNKIIDYFQNNVLAEDDPSYSSHNMASLFDQLDTRNIEYLCDTCLRNRARAYNRRMMRMTTTNTMRNGENDQENEEAEFKSIKDKDIVISLLCVLLQFQATMERSMKTVLDLLGSGELTGKCAVRCLGQLHAAIYKQRFDEEREDEEQVEGENPKTSRSMNNTLRHNRVMYSRQLLIAISDSIFSIVEKLSCIDTKVNVKYRQDDDARVNGVISALELLPTIMNTAQYLEQKYSNVRSTSTNHSDDDSTDDEVIFDRIMLRILAINRWHPKLFVVLLNIFVDIDIKDENLTQQLVKKIHKDVSVVFESDYVPLAKILLQLADKYQQADFIFLIRSLFPMMKSDSRLNTCFMVSMELKNSLSLVKLMLSSFKSFYASRSNVLSLSFIQHLCDMILMLLAYENEMCKDEVLSVIANIVVKLSKSEERLSKENDVDDSLFSTSLVSAASSSSNCSSLSTAKYVEKLFYFASRMELLGEILLVLCCDWCYKQKVYLRVLGESILVHLFSQCPSTQESILSTAFNVIAEEPRPLQKSIYFNVLKRVIAFNSETLIHNYVHKIKDWLSYLPTFSDVDISMQLLKCFATLSSSTRSHDLQNFLYIMLKKLIPKRSTNSRRLAIYGFTVLLNETSDAHFQKDILSSLRAAFSYKEEVLQTSLYKYLSDMLEVSNLHPSCMLVLYKILSIKVKKYLKRENENNEQERWALDIEACFEDNGTEGKPIISMIEPVTELFKCFFNIRVRARNNGTYNEIDIIFNDLTKQLTDIRQMCLASAITKKKPSASLEQNKSQKQKEKSHLAHIPKRKYVEGYLINSNMRLSIIVPLYEMMIQFVYNDSFKVTNRVQKSFHLFEIYSILAKIQSTFQRGRMKPLTDNLFSINISMALTKELCSELVSIIPNVRAQSEEVTPAARVVNHASLISLDQLLAMINPFVERLQSQELIQNNFIKVAGHISEHKLLLDVIDEPQMDHHLNDSELLCLKIIIITRYIFSVYQQLHPWKSGIIPDDSDICSSRVIRPMAKYIEEQRFQKIVGKTSSSSVISSFRTKCVQLTFNLFNKYRFVEEKGQSKALSQILLYIFGEDLPTSINAARSTTKRKEGRVQTSYSFRDLIVYFCLHLDKETKIGCTRDHFSSCIKTMSALASVYPPTKELSSTTSAIPLVNHITTKRSQTIHKACKILERILTQYILTHSTLVKLSLTFMLTFSQTERSLQRCEQIISTCYDKYHGVAYDENKDYMNICEKDKCAVESILCVMSYIESLLTSNSKDDLDIVDGNQTEPLVTNSSTDKNMENIDNIVSSIERIIVMVFEDEKTRKVFYTSKIFHQLEKRIENLLSRLCKYTISNCKVLRQELARAAKKVIEDEQSTDLLALRNIIHFRTENYYSICRLLSKMQYYRGSILTSGEKESFSDKYASLISHCEKLSSEIRALHDKFKSVQSTFTQIELPNIPVLTKLATTEIELLIQDDTTDDETDPNQSDSEEPIRRTSSGKDGATRSDEQVKIRRKLKKQQQLSLKRKRIIEDRIAFGERISKKQKSKQSHLRSRNRFIDFNLGFEGDSTLDTYADLEDFVDDTTWEPKE